jgi:peptide subunit release factor 1 (eRF1)
MISLIIPPKDQISRVSKMLADEFGTASNIKSRVNRLSVLGAITSVQHRLKLYTKGMHLLYTQVANFNVEWIQDSQFVAGVAYV